MWHNVRDFWKKKTVGKCVDKQIAKLVNLAREYNVDGRSTGKQWQDFLKLRLISIGIKYDKKAIDDICNKIEEYIKTDFLGTHRAPNNQQIKRWIDSKYPNAAIKFGK